ncbi:MAG: D-glycero-beta-D-manno-heptose 1-phosphate adenylyltransferase, partial [Alcaligenaceae bacterium]|nr:D-glycero-beta-D-manno-heptose 1-phosphate adenylyltransferase [Alcaligenaceae bacterium]
VASLECVSLVTWFDEDTPLELIEFLRPDLIVKGGDYTMEALPETARVRSWGGNALAIPFEFQRSTTTLVGRIRGGST